MKKILYPVALTILFLPSCGHGPEPQAPTAPSITNDITGAIGGVEIATDIGGPPVSLPQVVCYSLVGVWTGLSASGFFGEMRQGWPGQNYNVDLNAVTQQARTAYAPGQDQYSDLGEIHNKVLDAWARSAHRSSFGDNDETKSFISGFFDSSTMVAGRAQPCYGGRMGRYIPVVDSLTRIGVKGAILSLDDIPDIDSYFDGLLAKYPKFTSSINVFREIIKKTFVFTDEKRTAELEAYMRDEVGKMNSNYYNFDYTNLAAAIAMANIFVHSYYYWNAYYGIK